MLTWATPQVTGGSPVTTYSVTASPGGQRVTTSGDLLATVTGLINGTSYTGATNAQLAERRQSSVRTVANQVAALLRKLEVSSRTELVARLASR